MNPTSAPPIPSTGTCANCRQQRIAVRAIKSGDLPLCHHCLEQAALIFTPRNHFTSAWTTSSERSAARPQ
jgi:hypothetical protein